MGRQLKRKRVMSSSEDEDIPASQAQSSSFIVDSVLRTMLSNSSASSSTHPTLSQSSSTPLFALYRQANLEANKGLRGKARSSKSMGGRIASGGAFKNQVLYDILSDN